MLTMPKLFFCRYSVVATSLLMSPILCFLEAQWTPAAYLRRCYVALLFAYFSLVPPPPSIWKYGFHAPLENPTPFCHFSMTRVQKAHSFHKENGSSSSTRPYNIFKGTFPVGLDRRKIRHIEVNAKCRYLKKLTCKGTLRQVFIKFID